MRTASTAAWVVHNLGLAVAWITTILSMKATESTKFSAVSRLLP